MTRESYGAGEGKQVAGTDADEEILPGGSGRRSEEQKTDKGEEGADGSGPAGCVGVRWAQDGDGSKQWDKDDDEAGDEGRFGRSGTGQPCGLELVSSGQE